MPWRRYDERFERHPKVLALIADQGEGTFYRLMRLHGYSAEFRTEGHLPATAISESGVKPKQLAAMIQHRLIDQTPDGLYIHDWIIYTDAPVSDKVAWILARNPTASANEVVRQIGGTRQQVLNEVVRQRESRTTTTGSDTGSAEPPTPVPQPVLTGVHTDPTRNSRTDALSRSNAQEPANANSERDDKSNGNNHHDELAELLGRLGLPAADLTACRSDPARALIVARFVLAEGSRVEKPRAYFRKLWLSGELPEGAAVVRPPRPLVDVCRSWVVNAGASLSLLDVEDELAERESKRGERLTVEQRGELLALWRSTQAVL